MAVVLFDARFEHGENHEREKEKSGTLLPV